MYSTEAEFSRSLSAKLKSNGYDYTRIESHSTSVGIPDMFVQGHGHDFWLELKNDPKQHSVDSIDVKWRPGQLVWHHRYCFEHRMKKQVVTLISGVNGIYIVPMRSITAHVIDDPWFIPYTMWEAISGERLYTLFRIASERFDISGCNTYRDAVIAWVSEYFPDVDYDPEVIWEDDKIDNIDMPLEMTKVFYKAQLNLFMNLL